MARDHDGRGNLDALDRVRDEHGDEIDSYLIGALSACTDPATWQAALETAASCVTDAAARRATR